MNIYKYIERENKKITCPHCKAEPKGKIEFAYKGQFIVCPDCGICF